MLFLAFSSAFGASVFWAMAALMVSKSAKRFGSFELTRIQLISSSAILCVIVTLGDNWTSVSLEHGWAFFIAIVFGVILSNLSMFSCMRRGGPRRSQLLVSMNAPIAAILGYLFFDETITGQKLVGAGLTFGGVLIAILVVGSKKDQIDEKYGSFVSIILYGLLAAVCQAVGLIALKPIILAGTDPLAASAVRTLGGAFIMSVIFLWPTKTPTSIQTQSPVVLISAIVPGVFGYVCAVSLQLYALAHMEVGLAALLGSSAPIIMLPLIWIISSKPPSPYAWIGATLAIAGTGLVVFSDQIIF